MTKAQIQFFQSLSRQKYRKEHNAYLVEGDKNAREWLQSDGLITHIAVSEPWFEAHRELIEKHKEATLLIAKDFELEKITSLQHAQEVVLVVQQHPAVISQETGQWYLFLEKIQDPGNMGTIIRTADWFGIAGIYCSPDCVEIYNPKVVQASMGSLLRIPVAEQTTSQMLAGKKLPLYAATLSGMPLKETASGGGGIIAMGNESKGLSDELIMAAEYLVTIPRTGGAESLNVAVATGIICAALTGSR